MSTVTSLPNLQSKKGCPERQLSENQNSEPGDTCPVLPLPAMGSCLLCCVVLCLLGAGPVDSGVTQTPRHLIKARGQQVTLSCSPISGHTSVSWYQQAPSEGPQFLFEFYEKMQRAKGNFPDRFSGQQFDNYSSELIVNFLEVTDSALYFCASSLAQPCRVIGTLCTNLPVPEADGSETA
ncbi:t-cell receptor beta chain T17T-22-like protein [Camelus ferus]|nr:t-cell receptor beta chain T17T-22-like protein [Camelus ferus]